MAVPARHVVGEGQVDRGLPERDAGEPVHVGRDVRSARVSSQAGERYSRVGLHQTTGSVGFCRYTTLGGGPARSRSSAGWAANCHRLGRVDRIPDRCCRAPGRRSAAGGSGWRTSGPRAGCRPRRRPSPRTCRTSSRCPSVPRLSPKISSLGRSSGRHRGPPVVHRGDQRRGRVDHLGPVGHEGDPAGQVRVLHGDQGGVAGVHVLQRVGHRAVHPAGAGRDEHRDHRPLERAGPVHLADHQPGPGGDRFRPTAARRTPGSGPAPGRPANAVSSASVGPRPTKSRPCRPSVAHGASEYGPPERSDEAGATTSESVPSFATEARRSAMANRLLIRKLSTKPAEQQHHHDETGAVRDRLRREPAEQPARSRGRPGAGSGRSAAGRRRWPG